MPGKGKDNVLVPDYMLEKWELAEKPSVIMLLKTMEVCIQWCTIIEDEGILDPLNGLHLSTLHYVYLPQTSSKLEWRRQAWS